MSEIGYWAGTVTDDKEVAIRDFLGGGVFCLLLLQLTPLIQVDAKFQLDPIVILYGKTKGGFF